MTDFLHKTRPACQIIHVAPKSGGDAVQKLIVTRKEETTFYRDGPPSEIRLIVRYDTFTRPEACFGRDFSARYTAKTNSIKVPDWDFYLHKDLRDLRLGAYILNDLVSWAKQWPDADIEAITLAEVDADDENRERRNTLYERFNYKFDFDDPRTRRTGQSLPMKARDLIEPAAPVNITEFDYVEYLRRTTVQSEKNCELAAHHGRLFNYWRDRATALESNPLRRLFGWIS